MELNHFGVIKRMVMTGKSWHAFQAQNKLTFEVAREVNKTVIKDAVEQIWKVKVEKVNIINTPDHSGMFARKSYVRPGLKRAIVTLKSGYRIDLPGEAMTSGSVGDRDVTSSENEG